MTSIFFVMTNVMKFFGHSFVIPLAVLCLLSAGPVRAGRCEDLFNSNRTASNRGAHALAQLPSGGISYFKLSQDAEQLLLRESEALKVVEPSVEDWDLPKFDAVRKSFSSVERQISDEILKQLQSALPLFSWKYLQGNGRGNAQGRMPPGAKTVMMHPEKYIEEWHRDTHEQEATMNEQKFLRGELNEFILRVTIALPFGAVPPTLVRSAGHDNTISIDAADFRFAAAFIRDFVWHTTPQFEQDFRFLYVFDFQARKR